MIYKYLPVAALLLFFNAAIAQTPVQPIASFFSLSSNAKETTPAIKMPVAFSGGEGSRVHFYTGIGLGYASATTNAPGTKIKGGFWYSGELGVKIEIPTRKDGSVGIITVGLSGAGYSLKRKYTAAGTERTDELKFSEAGLPISYTRIRFGRNEDGIAFYWQAGATLHYLSRAKQGDKDATDQFNKIYAEPFVSLGVGTHFSLVNRRSRETVGGGMALIGPFFGYSVMNVSANSSASLNPFTIGLRWTYIWGMR